MVDRDVRVTYYGSDKTRASVKSVRNGLGKVKGDMDGLSRRAVGLQRTFAALTLGFGGSNLVSTLGDLQTSIARVRGLSQNFGQDMQFVSSATRRLNLDLQDAAGSYSKILALQAQGLIDNSQSRDLFTGYQEAAIKFGASTSDIQLSLIGLRQALTAGVIRAQEFDQITDSMSAVLPAVAKQMGITTKELLKFRTSASLSSKEFVNALIPALLEFEGSAAQMSKNIGPQLKRLSNAYKNALLEFEQPIGTGIQQFVDAGIASIDAFVEHSDEIAAVGATIAAVYGARALAPIGNFVTEQAKATAGSIQHSNALKINAANTLKAEGAALRAARAESAYTAQKLAQTNAALAANRAGVGRNAILGELAQRQARAAAATNALQAAQLRYNAALVGVTAANRTAAVSTAALAAAQRAGAAALALVGGPAGAAILAAGAIAFYATRQNGAEKATDQLREANERLTDVYRTNAGITRENAAALIDSARAELFAANARLQAARSNPGLLATLFPGAEFGRLVGDVKDLQDELEAFELNSRLQADTRDWAEEFQTANRGVQEVRASLAQLATQSVPTDLVSKLFPNDSKIKALQEQLAGILDLPEGTENRQRVADALQKEIDKLTGATKAREAYRKSVQNAKKDLDSLSDSLLTERQQIEKTFANATDTVELNVRLKLIDEDGANRVLDQARLRKNEAIKALNAEELEELRDKNREAKQLREDEIADFKSYRDRLIAARTTLNRGAGERERFRAEIIDLNAEREKAAISDQEYYLLAQAALANHNKALADIQKQRLENEKKTFAELSLLQQTDFLSGIAGNVLQSFQQNVGSYIELNDSMTASERKAAAEQNRINRKKFRDNQKYQLGQVAVNAAAGIMRAYADYDFASASAIALGIGLIARRQARNIRSGSFGGSSGAAFGGGNSVNPNEQAAENAQNAQPSVTQYFIVNNTDITDNDKLARKVRGIAQSDYQQDRQVYRVPSTGERVELLASGR